MANTAQDFEAVFTTYRDVKQANPGWSDLMVDDYLSLKRNVIFLSEVGDSSIDQIEINRLDIELLGFEIDALDVRLTQAEADIVAIELRLDALEALTPIAYYIIADHIVTANETITCGNVTGITVTLPVAPIDQQRVSIKRSGGIVSLDANGKLIDGQASIIISRKYTGLTIEYSADAGYWSII